MPLIGAVDEDLLEPGWKGKAALLFLRSPFLLLLPAGPHTAPQPRHPRRVLQDETKGTRSSEVLEGGTTGARAGSLGAAVEVIQQPCPTSGQKGKGEVGRVN